MSSNEENPYHGCGYAICVSTDQSNWRCTARTPSEEPYLKITDAGHRVTDPQTLPVELAGVRVTQEKVCVAVIVACSRKQEGILRYGASGDRVITLLYTGLGGADRAVCLRSADNKMAKAETGNRRLIWAAETGGASLLKGSTRTARFRCTDTVEQAALWVRRHLLSDSIMQIIMRGFKRHSVSSEGCLRISNLGKNNNAVCVPICHSVKSIESVFCV